MLEDFVLISLLGISTLWHIIPTVLANSWPPNTPLPCCAGGTSDPSEAKTSFCKTILFGILNLTKNLFGLAIPSPSEILAIIRPIVFSLAPILFPGSSAALFIIPPFVKVLSRGIPILIFGQDIRIGIPRDNTLTKGGIMKRAAELPGKSIGASENTIGRIMAKISEGEGMARPNRFLVRFNIPNNVVLQKEVLASEGSEIPPAQ